MVTKKQIAEWRKEGKRPVSVEFDDGKTAILNQPTRKQLKLIFSKAGQGGPIGMTEAYVRTCYLGGSLTQEELMDETVSDYIAQLAATVDELLNTKKAIVKKL